MLAVEPDNAAAHHELSTSLYLLGHVDESLAELDRTIELDPMNGRHYAARGYKRLRIGEGEASLADFDRALTDQPADYSWYFYRAHALAWFGRQEEAKRDIDAGFALLPDDDKGWESNEICWELLLEGRIALATPLCEQAVALAADAPSLDSRAFLYWQLGQTEMAEAALARAQSMAQNPWFFEPKRRIGQFPTTLAQGLLTFLGYRPDLPDREFGEPTRRAIMDFQRDHGLKMDGTVSLELIEALKSARP